MYVFNSLKSKYGCSSISLTSERQMCKKMCMVSRAKEVQRGLEIKENGYCHEGQKKMRGGMGGQGWAGEGKDDTSQSVSLIGLESWVMFSHPIQSGVGSKMESNLVTVTPLCCIERQRILESHWVLRNTENRHDGLRGYWRLKMKRKTMTAVHLFRTGIWARDSADCSMCFGVG